jgi:threonine synthase
VATNQNDVLHRLFKYGQYSLSEVSQSLAPSMDIQIASNFERLLYFILDGDTQKLTQIMAIFSKEGKYCFDNFQVDGFSSSSVSDDEIPEIIRNVQEKYDYLVDPHTACAFKDLKDSEKYLILATAHPAKFPNVYETASLPQPKSVVLEELKEKKSVKFSIGSNADAIRSFIEDKIS